MVRVVRTLTSSVKIAEEDFREKLFEEDKEDGRLEYIGFYRF